MKSKYLLVKSKSLRNIFCYLLAYNAENNFESGTGHCRSLQSKWWNAECKWDMSRILEVESGIQLPFRLPHLGHYYSVKVLKASVTQDAMQMKSHKI